MWLGWLGAVFSAVATTVAFLCVLLIRQIKRKNVIRAARRKEKEGLLRFGVGLPVRDLEDFCVAFAERAESRKRWDATLRKFPEMDEWFAEMDSMTAEQSAERDRRVVRDKMAMLERRWKI
jgi:hypothetical protein